MKANVKRICVIVSCLVADKNAVRIKRDPMLLFPIKLTVAETATRLARAFKMSNLHASVPY